MSSKPTGLRFTSVSSQTNQQPQQPLKTPAINSSKTTTISIGKKPSNIVYTKKPIPTQTMQTTKKLPTNHSPYGKILLICWYFLFHLEFSRLRNIQHIFEMWCTSFVCYEKSHKTKTRALMYLCCCILFVSIEC